HLTHSNSEFLRSFVRVALARIELSDLVISARINRSSSLRTQSDLANYVVERLGRLESKRPHGCLVGRNLRIERAYFAPIIRSRRDVGACRLVLDLQNSAVGRSCNSVDRSAELVGSRCCVGLGIDERHLENALDFDGLEELLSPPCGVAEHQFLGL